MYSSQDLTYMRHALMLAAKGMNTTTPNPRVGCVLVKNDVIVGEGWHVRAGEPHAEVNAIGAAGRHRAAGAPAQFVGMQMGAGKTPGFGSLFGGSSANVPMQSAGPGISGLPSWAVMPPPGG